jgi:hypothetical protein
VENNNPEVYADLVELESELNEEELALKRAIVIKSQGYTKFTLTQLEEAIDELVRLNIR